MKVEEFVAWAKSPNCIHTKTLMQAIGIIKSQRAALQRIDSHIVQDSGDAAAMFQEIARQEIDKEV